MSENTPESTDTQPLETSEMSEAPQPDVPFDKDDLTHGPDDVVHNSDADPDSESDPAKDDGTSSDWTDEGGATDDGPATDAEAADPKE